MSLVNRDDVIQVILTCYDKEKKSFGLSKLISCDFDCLSIFTKIKKCEKTKLKCLIMLFNTRISNLSNTGH